MHRWFLIGLWLLGCGNLCAQCPGGYCPSGGYGPAPSEYSADSYEEPIRSARGAIVRICVMTGGSQSLGSGTLIDKNTEFGLVLTCAHLFRDGAGRVTVVFPDNRGYGAKLLKSDAQADLAALLIYAPTASPVFLAESVPARGAWAASCGYGPYGRFACNRGRVLGYASEIVEISGAARQGDSGGPVLNGQGQLVAVLFGTDGKVVDGTSCGIARSFLGSLSGRFRGAQPDAGRPQLAPVRPGQAEPDLAAIADKFSDTLTRKLSEHEQRIGGAAESLQQRLGSIDNGIRAISGIAGKLPMIERGLEDARAAFDPARLQTILGSVAKTAIANEAPSALHLTWLALVGALGLSAPPAGVFVGLRLLRWFWRRKTTDQAIAAQTNVDKSASANSKTSLLHDDYARQLLEVFQLSGRSPVQDATLGREYDEEMRRAEQSSDATLASWARKVRERVEDKFHRIHTFSPAPAEPIRTSQAERQPS